MQKYKGYYGSYILGLHILPAHPKVGIDLFAIILTILLVITSTTQSTSSQQPLVNNAEAGKNIPGRKFSLDFNMVVGMVEVACMLLTRVALYMASNLTSLLGTSLNFILQCLPVHPICDLHATTTSTNATIPKKTESMN